MRKVQDFVLQNIKSKKAFIISISAVFPLKISFLPGVSCHFMIIQNVVL